MIEIDLNPLSKQEKHYEYVTVHPKKGKPFKRRQLVGRKEEVKNSTPTAVKPNPEIYDTIKDLAANAEKRKKKGGRKKLQGIVYADDAGNFTFISKQQEHYHFKMEGNDFINTDTNARATLPNKSNFILGIKRALGRDKMGFLARLDSRSAGKDSAVFHKEKNADHKEEIRKVIKGYETFVPELKEIEGDESANSGKYSVMMHLKVVTNQPKEGIKNYISWPEKWYDGDPDTLAIIGKAATDMLRNGYDDNNIYHSVIKPAMEASRIVNKKHGSDVVFRGETDVKVASNLIRGIVRDKEITLADRMFSTTENEKLAKWYASVHDQGYRTKTNTMIAISRKQFGNNIIMDYRVCGDEYHPEQEITICGNDIKLSADDVIIYTTLHRREKKRWMTLSDYIAGGGDPEEFIKEMQEWVLV